MMEPMLNFINKFTNVVRAHIEETKQCIGKDVVDVSANKIGICVDKVKVAFGAKFSLLSNYNEEQMKYVEGLNEDVLVCQGTDGIFFIPFSEVVAIGQSVMLVRTNLNRPDVGNMGRRREEVFRRFFSTKEAIKEFIPKVETSKPSRKKKLRRALKLFY